MKKRITVAFCIVVLLIGNVISIYGANDTSSNITEEKMGIPLDEFVEKYNIMVKLLNIFSDRNLEEMSVSKIKDSNGEVIANDVLYEFEIDDDKINILLFGIPVDGNMNDFSASTMAVVYACDSELREEYRTAEDMDASYECLTSFLKRVADEGKVELNGFLYSLHTNSEVCAFSVQNISYNSSVLDSYALIQKYVLQAYKQLSDDIFDGTMPTIEQCYAGEFRSTNSYEKSVKTDNVDEEETNNDIVYVYIEVGGGEYYFTYSDNEELQGYMSEKDLEKIDASENIPQYEKELLGMKLQVDYSKMTDWDGWTEYTDSEIKDLTE